MKWVDKIASRLRGQKSMVMWCKRRYHEAFEAYKIDSRTYPKDGATIYADQVRIRTLEDVLYYLTGDEQWREDE